MPAPAEAPAFEPEPLEPAPVFMPLAEALADADPHLPELDTVTIPDTDRLIAAPAVAEAPVSDLEKLQTDVSPVTTSTPIQFPTRAQARARQAASRSEQPSVQPAAVLPDVPRPEAVLPDVPRPEAVLPAASFPDAPRFRAAATAPAAAPRSPGNAKPTSGRARRLATTGVTFVAMAFVALMAVSTSLPAEALLSSADVQAAARAAVQPTNTEPAQTLTMSGGTDVVSVQRDGYESKTIAEVAVASGIRMEATFTNNPNGTIQWPFAVGVHIGDRFGPRDCAGCSSNHGGQDFNPGLGAPIQSIADGVVSYSDDGEGTLGTHMIIDHMIDGKLVSSVYAHMFKGSMLFKTGDVVKVGQVIGKTGNTGMSTGPHLHLDIRLGGKDGTRVDPLVWLYANTN
ncbi:M23 family metallopeptidase [Cryobacterium fucosi]|nr:M23 family metallopeptidase [Cryobacterium fucosi]